ncbi:MAG TPA: Rrf2 family transcriptional regulator [Ignavibacteriaceae bacterium]|nr:Rrf2 family transcriptional regulator [Ignavibacteriaceae bacterium]
MKFSSQEEFGLRCLLRIGMSTSQNGLTIPEISQMEGLSTANAGKLLRALRLGGFIESTRGQTGGYKLARPANEIVIGEVLSVLGGKLFESGFCDIHAGTEMICTHTIDCSIRSLWRTIQSLLDGVLSKLTLKDLIGSEQKVSIIVSNFADVAESNISIT